MKQAYLIASIFVLILALIYRPEWILFMVFIIATLVILSMLLSRVIGNQLGSYSKYKSESISVKAPPPDVEAMKKYLTELEPRPEKPRRLPVVFGRMIDDGLQQLLDLIIRDIICCNLNNMGLSTNDIMQDFKEDIWQVIKNLHIQLQEVDVTSLVAVNIVSKITHHFEMIRKAQSFRNGNQKEEYRLSHHLKSDETERQYLRNLTDFLIDEIFPDSYSKLAPVRHIIREILTCKVWYPAIEIITDPDYINQKILQYLKKQVYADTLRKKSYVYAPSFEDFIQMVKDTEDPDILKDIRYSIVTAIIQATKLQSLQLSKLAKSKGELQNSRKNSQISQERQFKHYINQLTYAKSQCEKRLVQLGWVDYAVDEAVEATVEAEKKVIPLKEILDNPIGRQHFNQFMVKSGNKTLMGYWNAVVELHEAKRSDWHQLGTEIFYTYCHTPPPDIKVDKSMLKRMEAFLLGDKGPEVFYELQEQVLQTLEDKYYPSFLVSGNYNEMLLSMEDTEEAEDAVLSDSSTSLSPVVSMNNEVELSGNDPSNYARRKLSEIQEKLDNKVQALDALRQSLKPESKVLASLENEVETLQGEKRQLEAHLTRTEVWGEHLGKWRAVVQSAELSEENDSPQFVLVVHIQEDDTDSDAISTGWVVLRKLTDFQELHRKLCQLNSDVKNLELPSQSLKFLKFGKGAVKNYLEKSKMQIQKYLKFVLEDDRLNQSEALYTFLSPSSERLKQTKPSPKKNKFSLFTLFKSAISDNNQETTPVNEDEGISLLLDEATDGKSTGVTEGTGVDGIAVPLYNLMEELFDPGMFRWLRKTLITFVQITYNKTINRQICETVSWIFSESMICYYIQVCIKSWWPNDKLIEQLPPRTEEEKLDTRSKTQEYMLNNIPEFLSTLVGQQCSQRGMLKVFDALQNPRLNKQLFYVILEVVVVAVFPHWKPH